MVVTDSENASRPTVVYPGVHNHALIVHINKNNCNLYVEDVNVKLPESSGDNDGILFWIWANAKPSLKLINNGSLLINYKNSAELDIEGMNRENVNDILLQSTARGWVRQSAAPEAELVGLKLPGSDKVFEERLAAQGQLTLWSSSIDVPDGRLNREILLQAKGYHPGVLVRTSLLLHDKRLIARQIFLHISLKKPTRELLVRLTQGDGKLRVAWNSYMVVLALSPPAATFIIPIGKCLYELAHGAYSHASRSTDNGDPLQADVRRDSATLARALAQTVKEEHKVDDTMSLDKLLQALEEVFHVLGAHTLELPMSWRDEPWVVYLQKPEGPLRPVPGSVEWTEDGNTSTHLARLDKQSWLFLNLRAANHLAIPETDYPALREKLAATKTVASEAKSIAIAGGLPDFPSLELAGIPARGERPEIRLCRVRGDRLEVVLAVERGERSEELIEALTIGGLAAKLVWDGSQFGFKEQGKVITIPCTIRMKGRPKVVTPPPESLEVHVIASPRLWERTPERFLDFVIRYRDQKAVTVTLKRGETAFHNLTFPMDVSDDGKPIYRIRYFSPMKREWVVTEDSVLVIE
jgi:hypothetical protein